MNEEVSIDIDGERYCAEYIIEGDRLIVFFPDGSTRETELRGLNPKSAALVHLRNYLRLNDLKIRGEKTC